MLDLERLVRESGKPHPIIAAAADCTKGTLNRILTGRVQRCKLDILGATQPRREKRGQSPVEEGGLAVVGIRRVAENNGIAS